MRQAKCVCLFSYTAICPNGFAIVQIPNIGNFGLIDLDTPQDAFVKPSYTNPKQDLQLVFSDEFNVDNRSFYPGDDPYWEAVDLHYWAVRCPLDACFVLD
jgi:Beta-glucan synthesis-associated protein SKN1/KRE6/Sbg1